jgi:hypothetical protein
MSASVRIAVLFLEILDYVQLMAVEPTCEQQEEHLKRLNQRGHCSRVYRSLRHPPSFSNLAAPLLFFIIHYVRDVGVAGSNPVTPTIDFNIFFPTDTLAGCEFQLPLGASWV